MNDCKCKNILNLQPKCEPVLDLNPNCPVTLNVASVSRGPKGNDATINGYNAINIDTAGGLIGTMDDQTQTYTIDGSAKQDVLTSENAGSGIAITEEEGIVKISNTQTSAVWGNIEGDIDDQTDLQNEFNEKQDVIDDLETIRSGATLGATAVQSVTEGTENGTISVDGTDVAVQGLGSAAYTASTAYDVAGSASTAETNAKNYADGLASNYATAAQGQLADTALQPNDNISELVNDAGYITSAAIPTNYVTTNTTQTITGEKVFSGILNIPAGKTYIIAGNGGAKLGYFTYDIDGFSNITLQTMTASNRDINFKTNNSGKVKYKGKEIAIKEDIPTAVSQLTNDSDYQTGTEVANSIATETTNRENADINLQNQIDAITASSDVTDIVGTYAELQAYDTTTLPPNSIIKVLQDESRSDETTYYRWVITGGVGAWVLIGEEGPYYTKGEADAQFVPQTRTVNSKALSSNITLTAADVGALPDSTVIPTVNDATLTIQKNGVDVQTFTANQSTNATANITVPTDTSDLTNGAGYITGITSGDVTTALGYTPANASNTVTTDTAQTISARKTFGDRIQRSSNIDQTSTTGSVEIQAFNVMDKNNNSVSMLNTVRSSTRNYQSMRAYNNNVTGGNWMDIRVNVQDDGVGYVNIDKGASVENRNLTKSTSSKTDTYVATMGWVNDGSKSTNVVHRDGTETITGNKNFTGDLTAVTQTAGDNSTKVATTAYVKNNLANYVTTDTAQTITNTKTFTVEQKFKSASNTTTNGLSIAPYGFGGADIGLRNTSNAWITKLYFDPNGNLSLTPAPTGDTTSSTQVDTVGARNTKLQSYATMDWVNDGSKSTNVVHRDGTETITGNKNFTGDLTAVTQTAGDNSTKVATTAYVENAVSASGGVPTGSILPYGGSSAPTGFLLCDGSAVSRTTYADLFDVIGTTYGSGDGSTTFNLPNLSTAVLPSTSTVNVMGNGNALGIVDDISTEEKQHNALIVGSGTSSFSSAKVPFAKFELSDPLAIGSQASSTQEFGTVRKALGVSTLPQWSGLTGSITGVSVNYIIKA